MASKKKIGGKALGKGAKGAAVLQLLENAGTPRRKRRGGRLSKLVVVGSAGAAAVYFFDPQQGTRRRHVARDRAMALLRRGKDEAARKADYAAGQAVGAAHEARKGVGGETPKGALTDQELARKVESVIFRDADVPKGKINVDAAGSTVWLRGEADTQERIAELERQASEIPEVQKVENLLHLPGAPAPTRADTPEDQREDTTQPDAPRAPEAPTEVSGEQKVPGAEPSPTEKAASGEGRGPAPMGSS